MSIREKIIEILDKELGVYKNRTSGISPFIAGVLADHILGLFKENLLQKLPKERKIGGDEVYCICDEDYNQALQEIKEIIKRI